MKFKHLVISIVLTATSLAASQARAQQSLQQLLSQSQPSFSYGLVIDLTDFGRFRSKAKAKYETADVAINYRDQHITMSFEEFFKRNGLRLPHRRYAHTQQPSQTPQTQEVAKVVPGKPESATPQLKAEELLKIRDVQYRHAQRGGQMKDLERQYVKLQTEQEADVAKVNQIITDAAKAANIDLTKWSFDIEELKFIPRDKPAPATGAPPPNGGTPNTKAN